MTPGHGVVAQGRTAQGAPTAQAATPGVVPTYLKVARIGVSFTAYTSPNGKTRTGVPGSTVTLANLSGVVLRGLAMTSHNQGTGGTVAMGTVELVG
ncbi:MAG: hypothetical protein IVW52_16550 [Acidimicrobiales bacterium]|nr:hypothetical protein [Acidimicrobiales bacterium]